MSLSLTTYPSRWLRRKIKQVQRVEARHQDLLEQMLVVMRDYRGIGLAASQVALDERLVVIDLTEDNILGKQSEALDEAALAEAQEETTQKEAAQEELQEATESPIELMSAPLFMINPEIIWQSKDTSGYEEGCLSLPEIKATVKRPSEVRCKFLNPSGQELEINASGLLATCIQHEIDHLNGKLFIDHLSRLKRESLLRQYRRMQDKQDKEIKEELKKEAKEL